MDVAIIANLRINHSKEIHEPNNSSWNQNKQTYRCNFLLQNNRLNLEQFIRTDQQNLIAKLTCT